MSVLIARQKNAPFFNKNEAISELMSVNDVFVLVPPRFEEIADECIPNEFPENSIGFFSSGTTGLPKVHFLQREKLRENALLSEPSFNFSSSDRVLILASSWHIAGFTWFLTAQNAGATVHIETPYLEKVDSFASLINAFKPTVICAVPSVLHALLPQKWDKVPHIIIGGAPLPAEDFGLLSTKCSVFTQAYGQTEAGGILSSASISSDELTNSFFRCVGNSPKGISLFCDGTVGNAQPILALSPSATIENVYETGDLGWNDENGRLFVIGRKENSGNCNILTGISMVLHK